MYAVIRPELEQYTFILFQSLWHSMAEGCQAERMLMSARFNEGQIRIIEIALRVYRANIGVTDKQPIWRAQWHQVTTEID